MTSVRVLLGDCREVLASLEAKSVQCCVTSPPYFGLRDYGVDGQIGLEATPDEYIGQMVDVFREVRRVLREDGTLWLNIGDSYNAHPGQRKETDKAGPKQRSNAGSPGAPSRNVASLKPKDLLMIPARVAIALQADGWYLRSDIIWHKPNPMPESVTDRPTSAHEHVFLLTKSQRYFYDAEAIKEIGDIPAGTRAAKGGNVRSSLKDVNGRPPEYWEYDGFRNARNVWTITTQPFAGAHFATMPPDLAERCIRAGTSDRGCCDKCGAPWERLVAKSRTFESGSGRAGNMPVGKNGANLQGGGATLDIRRGPVVHTTTTGWVPTCKCVADMAPCTVLDPFGGAGTTGLVADRLGRDAILIELNPAYQAIARNRVSNDAPLFAEVSA